MVFTAEHLTSVPEVLPDVLAVSKLVGHNGTLGNLGFLCLLADCVILRLKGILTSVLKEPCS